MKAFSDKSSTALLSTRPIRRPAQGVLEDFNTERILYPNYKSKDVEILRNAQDRYRQLTSGGTNKFYLSFMNQMSKSRSMERSSFLMTNDAKVDSIKAIKEEPLNDDAALFRDRNKDMFHVTVVTLNRKNTVVHPKYFENMGTMCISELWSNEEKSRVIESHKEYHEHHKVRHSLANMHFLRLNSRASAKKTNFFKEKKDENLDNKMREESKNLMDSFKFSIYKTRNSIIDHEFETTNRISEPTSDIKMMTSRMNSRVFETQKSFRGKIPPLDLRSSSITIDQQSEDYSTKSPLIHGSQDEIMTSNTKKIVPKDSTSRRYKKLKEILGSSMKKIDEINQSCLNESIDNKKIKILAKSSQYTLENSYQILNKKSKALKKDEAK